MHTVGKGQMRKYSESDEKQIANLYLDDKLSPPKIAEILHIPKPSIEMLLKKMGIRRSQSEAMKLHSVKGQNNPNWKGGKIKQGNGYIQVKMPEHPRANKRGYVLEHIILWEKHHQCSVPKGWDIHHLNGIRDDNRIENLIAMPRGKHMRQFQPYRERIRELEKDNKKLENSLLDAQQKLIRALEKEQGLLWQLLEMKGLVYHPEKALDESQMIFRIEEN